MLLNSMKVVSFCHVLQGPACTQYLGDMGAQIIKIEPLGGERARRQAAAKMPGGISGLAAARIPRPHYPGPHRTDERDRHGRRSRPPGGVCNHRSARRCLVGHGHHGSLCPQADHGRGDTGRRLPVRRRVRHSDRTTHALPVDPAGHANPQPRSAHRELVSPRALRRVPVQGRRDGGVHESATEVGGSAQ